MGEITWLEWPKGYNGWARFTLSKAVWALLAKPFWKLKVVPFNKNTKLSLKKSTLLRNSISLRAFLSLCVPPPLKCFFFSFRGKKKKKKKAQRWNLSEKLKVENRFCTGRNSINFIWIPLALKWQNQSPNGPIYIITNQAGKLLWVPGNSVDTVIFIAPNFSRSVSATWLPQYLRYRIWSQRIKEFQVQTQCTETSRLLNKNPPLGREKSRTIWLTRKKWPQAQSIQQW